MPIGLLAALLAACAYGVASTLQGLAAQGRTRPLLGLIIDPRYVAGLVLDLAGFCLGVLAVRSMPLYVVQAIVASSLAVTAVLSRRWLDARLGTREWTGVGAVCIGLALVGLSAGAEGPPHSGPGPRVGVLAGVVLLAAASIAAARARRFTSSVALGGIAGLGFGAVAVAARVMPSLHPRAVVADPAAYALVIAGVLGTLFFATALARGRVAVVTAAMVVGETVMPAIVGTALLGDAVRRGTAPVAITGFAVAVCGLLLLAKFGAVGAEAGR